MPFQTDPPGAPLAIAVVDDDPAIAEALSCWLSLLDIPCWVHGSAESLVAQLPTLLCTPGAGTPAGATADLALRGVVLDINLPGMSGLALSHRIRGHYPRLPIALITALSGPEIETLGPLPQGVVCLQKPFDLFALQALLLPPTGATQEADRHAEL